MPWRLRLPRRSTRIKRGVQRCTSPLPVHLAPRRNDLFDVYSRSLTLIKITAQPVHFSLPFSSLPLLSFSSSSLFPQPSLSPSPSRRTPSGDRKSYHQQPTRDFRFFYPARRRSAESDPRPLLAAADALIRCAHYDRRAIKI